MRMVYKIILGMLLFNAFLAFYNPLFDTSIGENAVNITAANMTMYNPNEGIGNMITSIFLGNMGAWGILGLLPGFVITITGLGAALITKNYVFIGVSIFISIVITLYINMSFAIMSIGRQADMTNTTGYFLVASIITIVGIAIGLMVVFNVVDMFAPAGARE